MISINPMDLKLMVSKGTMRV